MVNDGQLIFSKSYFNEECQTQIVDGMEMMFPIRKISTYINFFKKMYEEYLKHVKNYLTY
jgi:hypothetical protein